MALLHPDARILVVDDDASNVSLLKRLLTLLGYSSVIGTQEPHLVPGLVTEMDPDVILLDLNMPGMDGYDVMALLRDQVPESVFLPILVLTADVSAEAKQRALEAGAIDFLTKPFDHVEVALRIRNIIRTRRLHVALQDYNRTLEEEVAERTAELEDARVEIIERLALAAEYRDDDTGLHTRRVGYSSALIATQLGFPPDRVRVLERAAPLHDVGKIGIPDSILLKPDRLTDEEFNQMKRHTAIGAGILSGSRHASLRMAETIALTHHERWDGFGYLGLSGDAIPIEGRIVTVADVFDALTHDRPYKTAWSSGDAVEEIKRQAGSQFDPRVVEAFVQVELEHELVDLTDEQLQRGALRLAVEPYRRVGS